MRNKARAAAVVWTLFGLSLSLAAATTDAPSPAPPIAAIIEALDGLVASELMDASYRAWLARSPETVILWRVPDILRKGELRLDDLSIDFRFETEALVHGMAGLLQEYDVRPLDRPLRTWMEAYKWLVDSWVELQPYAFHEFALNELGSSGYLSQLADFLRVSHPPESEEDVRAYLQCISEIPGQVNQIIEYTEYQRTLGIVPPQIALESVLEQITAMLGADPALRPLSSMHVTELEMTLCGALSGIETLSDVQWNELVDAAARAFRDGYVGGLLTLHEYVVSLLAQAPETFHPLNLPDGNAYCRAMLRRWTSSSRTAEVLFDMAEREVSRILGEIASLAVVSGYTPFSDAFNDWIGRGQLTYRGDDERSCRRALQQLQEWKEEIPESMADDFAGLPERDFGIRVHPDWRGSCYVREPMDQSASAVVVIGLGAPLTWAELLLRFLHESIPGHHLQLQRMREGGAPAFACLTRFRGTAEGWATYAEHLGFDRGLLGPQHSSSMVYHLKQLAAAVAAVLELGIIAQGWTVEDCVSYEASVYGDAIGDMDWERLAPRFLAPWTSAPYVVGRLVLLEWCDRAQSVLGGDFSLRGFHEAVLRIGNVPLDVLEAEMAGYIAAQLPYWEQATEGGPIPVVTFWH